MEVMTSCSGIVNKSFRGVSLAFNDEARIEALGWSCRSTRQAWSRVGAFSTGCATETSGHKAIVADENLKVVFLFADTESIIDVFGKSRRVTLKKDLNERFHGSHGIGQAPFQVIVACNIYYYHYSNRLC